MTDAVCSLCRAPATLRRSHIIPEFFYKPIYDESHTFRKYTTDPNERAPLQQKGLREPLLGDCCEGRLSRWEGYAYSVLYGAPLVKHDLPLTVHRVEYAPFKLFQMSLLWRAAVSRMPEFGPVRLGRHTERLRALLAAENPGAPHEFGCTILYPPDPSVYEIFAHTVAPPQPGRYQAHHLYRFLLGGLVWLFVVSNHMRDFDESRLSLAKDGTLRLYNGGNATMAYLKAFAEVIGTHQQGHDRRR